MDNLLEKLGKWIAIIQAWLIGVVVLDTVLVIVIGVASNNIHGQFDLWMGILVFCSFLYLLLAIFKTLYQIKFPSSIIDELKSQRALESMDKSFSRQKAINDYIEESIKNLNAQTCSISYDDNENLCEEELKIRLKQLLRPLLDNPEVLLNTSIEKKFTIGIYLEEYYNCPKNILENVNFKEDGKFVFLDDNLHKDAGIIILQDELGFETIINKDLISDSRIDGSLYEIQSAIKRTINNLLFSSQNFTHEENNYSISCSPILEVCSDEYSNGVLFIIYSENISIPPDFKDVIGIFNRISANYISKYNFCVLQQIAQVIQKEQEKKDSK
jgi:hypothetical protein